MNEDRMDRFERGLEMLLQSSAANDEQIRKLAEIVAMLTQVVKSHEQRLSRLEGSEE